MSKFVSGFKEFIARGNAVDLAVGVVIGAAFSKIVDALVSGLITPLVAAIFGKPNLDAVGKFAINGAEFTPGTILTTAINFVLVALAIYVFVVIPVNKMRERSAKKQVEEEAAPAADVALLTEIRDLLRANQR